MPDQPDGTPVSDQLKTRSELRKALLGSWERNKAAYQCLAQREREMPAYRLSLAAAFIEGFGDYLRLDGLKQEQIRNIVLDLGPQSSPDDIRAAEITVCMLLFSADGPAATID